MHILIIAPEQIPVPPPVGGSVEHSIYQIAKKISNKHRVTIISRLRSNYPKRSFLGHITIVRVAGSNKPTIRKTFPQTPISIFLHSTTFISPPMTSKKQAASNLRGVNRIVGNSLSLQKNLKRNFPSISRKVRYVHLGVDLNQFRPRKQKAAGTHRP